MRSGNETEAITLFRVGCLLWRLPFYSAHLWLVRVNLWFHWRVSIHSSSVYFAAPGCFCQEYEENKRAKDEKNEHESFPHIHNTKPVRISRDTLLTLQGTMPHWLTYHMCLASINLLRATILFKHFSIENIRDDSEALFLINTRIRKVIDFRAK